MDGVRSEYGRSESTISRYGPFTGHQPDLTTSTPVSTIYPTSPQNERNKRQRSMRHSHKVGGKVGPAYRNLRVSGPTWCDERCPRDLRPLSLSLG